MTYDNNYFSHPYQGIPVGGYARMIEKIVLTKHIDDHTGSKEVSLNSILAIAGPSERTPYFRPKS